MKRKVVWTLCLAAVLVLSLAALARVGDPANPTLTEKRFQAMQLAAFFSVDPDLARQWVPPAWELALDAQGKATGALAVMDYPDYCWLRTPNSGPLEDGENVAPASIAHFWFVLKTPVPAPVYDPVADANFQAGPGFYYDVADLVTSPLEQRVYLRSGRAAILVSDIAIVDQGQTQTGAITFLNGSEITFKAFTPVLLPPPDKYLGGNVWQWHVGGAAPMGDDLGVRLNANTGHPSNVNRTRGQFLGIVPGIPNSTQVTIHADPDTLFVDCFGATDVVASRATFFRQNNIVLNWGRGKLLWTVAPPLPVPKPPILP